MKTSDLVRMAIGNLARRKGRTLLTLAGVVIGVAAVVLLVSLGIGIKLEILRLFQDDDEIRVLRITRTDGMQKALDHGAFNPIQLGLSALPITDENVAEIRKLPGVEDVMPLLNLFLKANVDGKDAPVPVAVAGIPDGQVERFQKYVRSGRVWSTSDPRPCLFPSAIAEVIGIPPDRVDALVGTQVVVSRNRKEDPPEPRTFTVVGVLDSARMGMRGREMLVPWKHAVEARELTRGGIFGFGYEKGSYLAVEVRSVTTDQGAIDELKRRLKNLNYQVLSAADIIGMINTVFIIVEGFMGCVGAIGLIVALFGIANTMAMSVLERTREIGVMKAIGGRTGDIRRIFLAEAAAIGFAGGLLGLLVGWIGSHFLSWLVKELTTLPKHIELFHVSILLAAGSVVFSIAVSVVAGWLPASRAARMQPVEALRYE